MSRSADRDLSGIIGYTINEWGKRKAKAYADQIRFTISKIAESPLQSPHEVVEGVAYKKRLSGHHLIYAQVIGDELFVSRILHEKMDAARHLN